MDYCESTVAATSKELGLQGTKSLPKDPPEEKAQLGLQQTKRPLKDLMQKKVQLGYSTKWFTF